MNQDAKNIDRRLRRTKNAIKSSLLTLMKDKPLSKITISELTEAADVNRKTFYNHYTDLKSVLAEIENDFLVTIFDIIDRDNIWNDIENPDLFLHRLFHVIEENISLLRLLMESGEHVHLILSFRKRLRELWSEQIFSEDTDPTQLTFLMDFVASGVVAILESWIKDPSLMSLNDLSSFAGKIVAGAVDPIIYPMRHKMQQNKKVPVPAKI